MACKRIICATFATLIVVTPAAPVNAGMGRGGGNDWGELSRMQYLHTHCNTLIGQFDRARPTQPEAIALRKRGEEYCYTNYHWQMEQGVEMLNQAIAMIGLTPQKYP
jgi:hypothetical protein